MQYKNEEAEKCLVCQMMLKSDIIPNVYDRLKPETFSSGLYRKCYEVLVDMQNKNIIIDLSTFTLECEKYGISAAKVVEISDATFTASNWEYYADLIKQCYISSSVTRVITEAKNNLNENNGAEVSNTLMQNLSSINANVSSCEIHDIKNLCANYLQKLDRVISNKGAFTGYATGLSNLDEILNGLQNEYIVIGARPSLGKTALGEQIALHTAGMFGGEGVKTAFIELEMSPEQLTERAISNLTKIAVSKMRSGFLTDVMIQKIGLKLTELSNSGNFIPVTSKSRRLSDIIGCLRRLVRNEGVKIAFIDHIGLIHPEGKYSSSWEGVREISNTLQQLQRELQIPIVVLSQVGREVEGKKPSLADLRGSGAIEEDADTIMFIERKRAESKDEFTIETKINVMKNRNGACGTAHLIFRPAEVRFEDDNEQKAEAYKQPTPPSNSNQNSSQSTADYFKSKFQKKAEVKKEEFKQESKTKPYVHPNGNIEYEMPF